MFKLFLNAQKKKAKKRAFTLVELVIVIVILGILAGVAAISFSNVTKDAKESVAKANLRAVKSALQMYAVENAGKYPTTINDTNLMKKYDPQLKATITESVAGKGDFIYEMTYTAATASAGEKIKLLVKWREGGAKVLEISVAE